MIGWQLAVGSGRLKDEGEVIHEGHEGARREAMRKLD